MIKEFLKFFRNTYDRIIQSIAFYPVLLSIIFILLAVAGIRFESYEAIKLLKENVPYLFIEDYETARSILTTLIGGVLSLTVFSFTMVMVVLSQASSNFSPRLLPNLVADRTHQIILGTYIGTLLFSIITLIALGANSADKQSLGMSTMFAAILGVFCIGLFVYFIHNISTSIQIHNITRRIYRSSDAYFDKKLEEAKEIKSLGQFDSENFETVYCHKTGYFYGFDSDLMKDSLKQIDNEIEILPFLNQHVWEGMSMMKIKHGLEAEDLKALMFCVRISSERHTGDEGISGMIKLMEIAVKAMSPGINDPGTAIGAIVKIGRLLKKVIALPEITVTKIDSKADITIIDNKISTENLMRILVQPIRLYSKNDASVMHELVKMMAYLLSADEISSANKEIISKELDLIKEDIEQSIDNDKDRRRALSYL